jgi:ankyrin repeat protein
MPSSIRKALNELPTTLDDTYERALQGIPKEKRQHAHRLFHCLVGAIRPLRAEELAEIFAIDFDSDAISNFMEGWRPENAEEAVLSTCSTLISVIEDKDTRIIQFSHFSVKEYLTSDRLRSSEVGNICQYHVPLDSSHTILARACLATLLQLDENVDGNHLEGFPLALYAAQNWVKHAKYEDVSSRIQDTMELFFNPRKPYLASWARIHNLSRDPDLRHWSNIEPPSPPGKAALYFAALCGFKEVANYLITHFEVDIAEFRYSGAPLHAASIRGHIGVVYLLLQHHVNVNAKCTSYFDWTPLHFASADGSTKVAQLLLEHGANVNAQSTSGGTPLKFASQRGHLEVVRLLLSNGADVHIQDRYGDTAFKVNEHVEIAQLLLEHGAEKE